MVCFLKNGTDFSGDGTGNADGGNEDNGGQVLVSGFLLA